jgi:hypothetical protein
MKVASLARVVCAAGLTGCSVVMPWRDVTHHTRGSSRMRSDLTACQKDSGYPEMVENASADEKHAAFARLKVCMAARGWESADQNPD